MIAILAGHGNGDPGAVGNNTREYDWNLDLVNRMVRYLNVPYTIVHRETYSGLASKVNSTGARIAIEFHCNSFSKPSATGSEVLYWHTSSAGKAIASKLQKTLVNVLGLADRGLKPISKGDRGWRFMHGTKMPCVLVESFFISNPNDLRIANERKEDLAKALAETINLL